MSNFTTEKKITTQHMLYETQSSLASKSSLSKLKCEPIATAPGSWFYV